MTTATRCKCCDLPAESCGRAVEAKQRAEAASERSRLGQLGFIASAYPGRCSVCGESFGSGTLIAKTRTGAWRAECCA